MNNDKLKILYLAVGFLLVVGLLGRRVALAWTPPTGTPPDNNAPAPLHVGETNQAKKGSLTLGDYSSLYGGVLNVKGTICLNGSVAGADCIDEWPVGGGGGSGSNYWGRIGTVDDPYIYPLAAGQDVYKIYDSGKQWLSGPMGIGVTPDDNYDLKINNGSITAIYAKAATTAIQAETYNDGVTVAPAGRGAISGRDDNTASAGSPVWGVLGMANGETDTLLAYQNFGVYGYAPNITDGVGVKGLGGYVGVHGYGNTGVLGAGGVGGQFAGNLGVYSYSYTGGTGLWAHSFDLNDPNVGQGIFAEGGAIGINAFSPKIGVFGCSGDSIVCGIDLPAHSYAGWFRGAVYVDGDIKHDNVRIEIGPSGFGTGGDSLVGYPNLWLDAGGASLSDSVRVGNSLEIKNDLKVNGDSVYLKGDSQSCDGGWAAKGSFVYLDASSRVKTATLCVLQSGITDWLGH